MRIIDKIKKKIRGSITVLLVIILLPIMTFSAIVVDLSRINMARQMMSSAGDLAMNTALANYDTILKDVYGLFAMSQANGLTNDQLGEELNNYFAKTLSSYNVVPRENADDYVEYLIGDFRHLINNGKLETNNFLELNDITFKAERVESSSLANASAMRKQIVEYMKYRAPLGLGLSFLESLTSFEKMEAQNTVVEAQVKAQESTQDVTKACQKLITLIRDYDKRVAEINGALNGVTGSTDGTVIPLEDYDTHVLKYLKEWQENYEHINKMLLVFQANTPSVDSVYLKSLKYSAGERYIDFYGNVYHGDSSTGFDVTITPAGDYAGAKSQVETQISLLNNNYKPTAKKYLGSMLSSTLLSSHSNNINDATISKENENTVIDNFIKFEKFLLDKIEGDSITYSQVKAILEQIAILDKYRANYEQVADTAIESATSEKESAQRRLTTAETNRGNAEQSIYNSIDSINNRIQELLGGETNKLGPVYDQLPPFSGTFSGYYNANIKSSGSENDKYIDTFKSIVEKGPLSMPGAGTNTQQKIIKEAKNFIKSNSSDFDTYMQSKFNATEKSDDIYNEDVYKILSCLYDCHNYAKNYTTNVSTYNTENENASTAQGDLDAANNKINQLTDEKARVVGAVAECLRADFDDFCNAYQADAYHYNYFINAAKNTINPEVQAIQTHFATLLGYVKELRDALNGISEQITVVKGAIETYNTNLDTWNTENTNYAAANGDDSFSSQSADDIEKARTEYNSELYDTLDTFVITMWNEFDTLYSKLSESTNFVYGSKRIDQIKTVDELVSAISGTSFSDIVTVEEATQKLATLYKGETIDKEYVPYTMDYVEPKQLGFLSPIIVQVQALKYLNSAFPEEIVITCGNCGKCSDCKTKESHTETENSYNEAKGKLTGATKDETDAGKDEVDSDFGYTFDDGRTVSGTGDLPTKLKGTTPKDEVKDSDYVLKEEGEEGDKKLNARDGVGDQKKKTSSVLGGIGNAATTAVENLYILNYIFENFSYNTIVQEQVLKDNKPTTSTIVGQIGEADIFFSDPDKISNAKAKTTTLSNFKINENNNRIYGGEIEYILFGNTNPKSNVTSVKASIYAIRFGFNCIYAFTNSEIRNSTMAAGLAVQAATLGIVPYQIVQIVLQLALAAAEAAIDLSAMNHGLSVAIIKTKDTWALSLSGGAAILKDAANAAANMVVDKVTDVTTNTISYVTNGLNDLINAGADNLVGAIEDLEKNMGSAAKGVLEGVVDDILTKLTSEIENGINQLKNVNVGQTTTDGGGKKVVDVLPDKATLINKTNEIFQSITNKISTIVNNACGGNEIALSIASRLEEEANTLVNNMKQDVLDTINASDASPDIMAFIEGKINDLKQTLIEYGNTFIVKTMGDISGAAQGVVNDIQDDLQGYVDQCGEELSEEAAKAIKDKVTTFTDDFVNNTLKVSNTSAPATDVKSSPVSMFKFGYKDYLMLLTYISICCGDSALVRTADLIQLNLQYAGEGAEFKHSQSSSFLMSKAYTYVSVSSTADLDMFFMDFSIFADQVAEDSDEVQTDEVTDATEEDESGTVIKYKGLLGY